MLTSNFSYSLDSLYYLLKNAKSLHTLSRLFEDPLAYWLKNTKRPKILLNSHVSILVKKTKK